MCGKDDPLPQASVVEHEQRSIDDRKPVIPEDVKDLWLGNGSVTNQPAIACQMPGDLLREAGNWLLVPMYIEKAHLRLAAEFREIQVIAAD